MKDRESSRATLAAPDDGGKASPAPTIRRGRAIGETAQSRAKVALSMDWLIGLLNLIDAKAPNRMARILIADDDELITELASEVLIDAGHACGWVSCASRPSYTICRWRCSLR